MNVLEPIHWASILMLVGCGLVVLEFFIPSGGILGFLSATAIVASIVLSFYHYGPIIGFVFVTTAIVLVPTALGLTVKYWPKTPMGRAFLGELPDEEDVAPEDARRELVGRFGVAKSKMLPAGAIEIDGRTIDAVSQGMAIEPGDRVVVMEVRGNRVMVRLAAPDERPDVGRPEDLLSQPIDELGIESLDDPLA
jgi:membrane-bound serine protease (ClpP class)